VATPGLVANWASRASKRSVGRGRAGPASASSWARTSARSASQLGGCGCGSARPAAPGRRVSTCKSWLAALRLGGFAARNRCKAVRTLRRRAASACAKAARDLGQGHHPGRATARSKVLDFLGTRQQAGLLRVRGIQTHAVRRDDVAAAQVERVARRRDLSRWASACVKARRRV
jgi:hypothetical protein